MANAGPDTNGSQARDGCRMRTCCQVLHADASRGTPRSPASFSSLLRPRRTWMAATACSAKCSRRVCLPRQPGAGQHPTLVADAPAWRIPRAGTRRGEDAGEAGLRRRDALRGGYHRGLRRAAGGGVGGELHAGHTHTRFFFNKRASSGPCSACVHAAGMGKLTAGAAQQHQQLTCTAHSAAQRRQARLRLHQAHPRAARARHPAPGSAESAPACKRMRASARASTHTLAADAARACICAMVSSSSSRSVSASSSSLGRRGARNAELRPLQSGRKRQPRCGPQHAMRRAQQRTGTSRPKRAPWRAAACARRRPRRPRAERAGSRTPRRAQRAPTCAPQPGRRTGPGARPAARAWRAPERVQSPQQCLARRRHTAQSPARLELRAPPCAPPRAPPPRRPCCVRRSRAAAAAVQRWLRAELRQQRRRPPRRRGAAARARQRTRPQPAAAQRERVSRSRQRRQAARNAPRATSLPRQLRASRRGRACPAHAAPQRKRMASPGLRGGLTSAATRQGAAATSGAVRAAKESAVMPAPCRHSTSGPRPPAR